MGDKINSFKDLIVWQKSIVLVSEIYAITKLFPTEEKFGLVTQLNRAVVSIPSNVAEGWGRESTKNYLQFLRNSRGSLMEVETLIIISNNLGYLDESNFLSVTTQIVEVGKILQGLIKSIKEKISITENR